MLTGLLDTIYSTVQYKLVGPDMVLLLRAAASLCQLVPSSIGRGRGRVVICAKTFANIDIVYTYGIEYLRQGKTQESKFCAVPTSDG